MPFRKGGLSFLEFQRVKLNAFGQSHADFICKILDNVFTGRLVIDQNNAMTPLLQFLRQFNVGGLAVKHGGMVELIDNFLPHNPFQISEIDHHSVLDMFRIINRASDNRHL